MTDDVILSYLSDNSSSENVFNKVNDGDSRILNFMCLIFNMIYLNRRKCNPFEGNERKQDFFITKN